MGFPGALILELSVLYVKIISILESSLLNHAFETALAFIGHSD